MRKETEVHVYLVFPKDVRQDVADRRKAEVAGRLQQLVREDAALQSLVAKHGFALEVSVESRLEAQSKARLSRL